jgi:hypothetical protein
MVGMVAADRLNALEEAQLVRRKSVEFGHPFSFVKLLKVLKKGIVNHALFEI